MMFLIAWITLIGVGLAASLGGLFWALRTGQFAEQGRARYLPLRGETAEAANECPAGRPAALYGLLFVIGVGMAAMLAAVLLTLWHLTG